MWRRQEEKGKRIRSKITVQRKFTLVTNKTWKPKCISLFFKKIHKTIRIYRLQTLYKISFWKFFLLKTELMFFFSSNLMHSLATKLRHTKISGTLQTSWESAVQAMGLSQEGNARLKAS